MSTDDLEHDDDTGSDDELDALDPIEAAWLEQEPEVVEQLARERITASPDDGLAHSWLGLALFINNKASQGQAELKKAFELIRAGESAAVDDDAKQALQWELHGIGNRLIDTVSDDAGTALNAATFIVEQLKLDHAPSLRLLSEDMAVRQGDPIRAAQLLKRALQTDPLDPESHYLAARLFARIGKKPQVLSHLQKSLDNASGTIAVRTLARFEPDFDGFRKDAEFNTLVDLFPAEEPLRSLYVALDQGAYEEAIALGQQQLEATAHKLDVLYPLREALELLLDQPEPTDDDQFTEELDAVQADIDAREMAGEMSPAYGRFCGDA